MTEKAMILYSPIIGQAAPISTCSDPVFSSGLAGEGMILYPETPDLVSPSDAVVTMILPTGRALGLRTEDGVEYLLHVGLSTGKAPEKNPQLFVKQGDPVKKGQLLFLLPEDYQSRHQEENAVALLVCNLKKIGCSCTLSSEEQVSQETPLLTIQKN